MSALHAWRWASTCVVTGRKGPARKETDMTGNPAGEQGPDIMGGPEPDEAGTDLLGGSRPGTDELGGPEPDEAGTDLLGG